MAEELIPPINTSPFCEFITRADGEVYAAPKFSWNLEKEQAAADLAQGVYRIKEIAERAGVHVGVLAAWRTHPTFAEKVAEHKKTYRELVTGYGIADFTARLQLLQTRHDELRETITARGELMGVQYPDIPAFRYGHIYEHITAAGTELRIDTKTPQLLNEMEKMAAIYCGQWSESTPTNIAVQIVTPANLPDVASLPTVRIGSRQI